MKKFDKTVIATPCGLNESIYIFDRFSLLFVRNNRGKRTS